MALAGARDPQVCAHVQGAAGSQLARPERCSAEQHCAREQAAWAGRADVVLEVRASLCTSAGRVNLRHDPLCASRDKQRHGLRV